MSFKELFKFKHFSLFQDNCAMKIGTDAFVLGSLVDTKNCKNILDIGSGTGVLGFMLNQYFNNCEVTFIEINEKVIPTLQENVKNNPINSQVITADFLSHSFDSKYDLIISNPPYFSDSTKAANSERILARDNESLAPEPFFKKVSNLLSDTGLFWIILPNDNSEVYLEAATNNNLFLHKEVIIFGKPEVHKRNVFAFGTQESDIKFSELTIRNNDGKYTDQYKALTKDFHGVEL